MPLNKLLDGHDLQKLHGIVRFAVFRNSVIADLHRVGICERRSGLHFLFDMQESLAIVVPLGSDQLHGAVPPNHRVLGKINLGYVAMAQPLVQVISAEVPRPRSRMPRSLQPMRTDDGDADIQKHPNPNLQYKAKGIV